MVPLEYSEDNKTKEKESESEDRKKTDEDKKSEEASSGSTGSQGSESAVSSGTPKPKRTPVMSPDAKKRLEEQRTELYGEMEEYKAKLGLIGVTVKEYGPAVMRLLGFLLNRKDRNKNRTQQRTAQGGELTSTEGSVDLRSTKTKRSKKKKLSTRRFDSLFGEKKLTSQSNEKQQRDALVLYSLFKKLNISQNCIDGSKLKADIKEKENKPNRYIFLFFKTIKGKQYVVGFVSGTKVENGIEKSVANIDYVCPRLDQPPDDTTKWRGVEELGNLVAYAVLKMLWLNDDRGQKKYASVSYKNHPYSTSKDVFTRLDRVKIDPYARQAMGFKRSLAPVSASSEEAKE
jgi:hypothetical protein